MPRWRMADSNGSDDDDDDVSVASSVNNFKFEDRVASYDSASWISTKYFPLQSVYDPWQDLTAEQISYLEFGQLFYDMGRSLVTWF